MKTNGVILTNSGVNLINEVLSNEKKLIFTKVEIGDGEITSIDEAKELNKIKNKIQINASLISVKQIKNNSFRIRCTYSNEETTEEMNIREIGVYVKTDDNDNEILFAYINDGVGEIFPDGTSGNIFERERDLLFEMESTVSIKAIFDENLTFVTFRELDELLEEKLDKGDFDGTAEELFNLIKKLNVCPYRVGDILESTNPQNPADYWIGTEWKQITEITKGVPLRATAGVVLGSNDIYILKTNLPTDRLKTEAHDHDRGTMEISGRTGNVFGLNGMGITHGGSGVFATGTWNCYAIASASAVFGGGTPYIDFVASRNWTGETSSSAPYTEPLGEGTPINLNVRHYTVYKWERTK